jgi:hypothetical protein
MSELTEKEIKVLKAIVAAATGGAVSAPATVGKPKAEAVEESEEEDVSMDEEKILAMDIDDLRELAEKIGLAGYKKMALKELRSAIIEYGSGDAAEEPAEEPAEEEDEKPAKKGKKKEEEEDAAPKYEVGQKVIAKWDEDGKWYEAKVISLPDPDEFAGKIKVKFIADQVLQNTKVANVKLKPKAE